MHKDLLSDKEREMLRRFLESGVKEEGFRMLKSRIKKNYQIISEDYKLISEAKDRL